MLDSSVTGALMNVKFPIDDWSIATQVQNDLFNSNFDNSNGIYTYLVIYEFENKLWVRLSCQIFNELNDFEWMAHLVLQLIDKYNKE